MERSHKNEIKHKLSIAGDCKNDKNLFKLRFVQRESASGRLEAADANDARP